MEPTKNKLSFKEQKELDSLDVEIARLEDEIKLITDKLYSGLSNDEAIEANKQIANLNDLLDNKSMRWIELTELKEAK